METETAAVIASSAVAIAAIAAGALDHRAGRKHSRERDALNNIRDVLDSAAELLHRSANVLDDVRLGLVQHGAGFFRNEAAAGAHGRLTRCGEECDALAARLAIRLGPVSDAVTTFGEANEAMLAIHRALGVIRLETDPPPDPPAAAQVDAIVDEQRETITGRREAFDRSRKAFTEIAFKIAGARLGG